MIPCVINNFNRLTTLKTLCNQLLELGYRDIHIVDNNSSYPPLLEWYNSCPFNIIRCATNIGPRAIYDDSVRKVFKGYKWIAYSDSDIQLNNATPSSFIEHLIGLSEKYNFNKAGLALSVDDLPDNKFSPHYRKWEKINWVNELEKDVYDGFIDTTFCVLNPFKAFDYKAIRVAGDYTAKHIPFYIDLYNLDEENKYYMEHCSELSTLKRFYTNEVLKGKI